VSRLRILPRALALTLGVAAPLTAQLTPRPPRPVPTPVQRRVADLAPARFDSAAFAGLRWREIGPFRGGRSVAAAGSAARPYEYYMGTTGGGVYKTTDGGITWAPITDKYFGGPIGYIAVAESNPDIVYVGTGEYAIRGNVSHGEGVWKSTDAGKTWAFVGLKETRQISRVRVHPTNPDIVYVAGQGAFWGPNPERGVFKSTDGGKSWRRVLYRNDSTGVSDLVLDPSNPNTLYAAFWQASRNSWSMSSGGPGGGIMKSTDGGETWTELTKNKGLPNLVWGNIGMAVSPANPSRVWALIEADSGGLFRSEDAGATWAKVNEDRRLRQRAWYYSRVFADPKDANTVYTLNTGLYRSTDGGKTIRAISVPHGDNHDLWIASNDPKRMINANDGGANVSFNGGASWSEQDFATAQFYHVTTTNEFPYRVCGAQQDNSTLCGPSRWPGAISIEKWTDAGGGESGYIAVDPTNPDISFAGSYGGLLTRKNMRTEQEFQVNPWPDNPMGHSSEDLTYRFQWTFPIVFSPHDPKVLYAGGNHVFRTTTNGQSWDIISPDLTRHAKNTMGASGGPITKDQTGVETYATIFTIAESPKLKGVIWTGSDDGLVFLTRNGGTNWTNVTPSGIGDFTRISLIEASPHDPAVAYIAANRYGLGDLRPILYKTADYGKTWTKIVDGIPAEEFTRAIREDPEKRGLLYAATERSVHVSFDDGQNWQSLKLNLPPVPVHDLVVKEGDLVVATHGRSFWILDDLSPLRQLTAATASAAAHLYKPRDVHRISWGGGFGGGGDAGAHPAGRNPPDGAIVYYTLATPNQDVSLDFLDAKGAVIKTFTSRLDSAGVADSVRADSVRRARGAGATAEQPPEDAPTGRGAGAIPRAPNKAGLNSFAWNLRYPDAVGFENLIMWAGSTTGPIAPPGTYQVRLKVGNGAAQTQTFLIKADPRSKATPADYAAQFAMSLKVRDRLSDANNAVRQVRNVRGQLADRAGRIPTPADKEKFTGLQRDLNVAMQAPEEEIYQTKNQSGQDPLNYPIRLNNKIAALMGTIGNADGRPTRQSYAVFDTLSRQLDVQLVLLKNAISSKLPAINAELRRLGLPEIVPATTETKKAGPIADDDDADAMERRKW
jgi:photosystem II stability/assembly factor-like uncharacterized protein